MRLQPLSAVLPPAIPEAFGNRPLGSREGRNAPEIATGAQRRLSDISGTLRQTKEKPGVRTCRRSNDVRPGPAKGAPAAGTGSYRSQ